ncbi:MAG: GNAT family N-acetyltransferase [Clostridia bacterium]|nr:GNAT family N-acetyltransferase [Clostridia bacterium]
MTEKALGTFEIVRASEKDLPCVKGLWQEIFGDDEGFIDRFYSAFPVKDNTLVAKDGEKVVGVVNALDCKLRYKNEIFCGKYIYALAVSEKYRGRGIARELLETAEEGSFVLLVPETPDLFDMYAHLGYTEKTQADERFTRPFLFFTEGKSDKSVSALVKIKDIKLGDFDSKKGVFYI